MLNKPKESKSDCSKNDNDNDNDNDSRITITILYKKIVDFSNFANELIQELEIPEGILGIGKSAFENCVNLERVLFPESIRSIGRKCFYNCISLKHLYIPKSLCVIDEEAFNKCHSLCLLVINNTFFKTENRFKETKISTVINDRDVIYLKSDLFEIVTNNCNFLITNVLRNDVYNYIRTNDNLFVIHSGMTIYYKVISGIQYNQHKQLYDHSFR